MNKDKTRSTIMLLAAVYLIYIGVTLLQDVLSEQPDNLVLFVVMGAVFIIVGIYVIISKAREMMKLQIEEAKLAEEEAENEGSEDESSENEGSEGEVEETVVLETNEIQDTDTDAFEREVEYVIDENDLINNK